MMKTQLNLRETQQIGDCTVESLIAPQQLPLLEQHGLGLVGRSEAQFGFHFVRPRPHFGQLLATQAGKGIVRVGDVWKELHPGMVYLTPPHQLSAYYAPESGTWSVLWVHLIGDHQSFPPFPTQLLERDLSALTWSIQGLLHEASGPAELEPLTDWVRLLATETRRLIYGTTKNTTRLSPLWAEVQANLAHPWTRDELAQRVSLSGERLRKLCQETLGMSPIAYVTRLRMQHAASLLASGRYSVAQVALRVGYDNTLAFSTAFKRVMGTTPSSCLPRTH